MLIIIGAVIVFGATLGGFMLAGGHPGVLLHVSEFVVILGIALGVLIIATPVHVIKEIMHKTKEALAGKTAAKKDFFDLLKLRALSPEDNNERQQIHDHESSLKGILP